MVSPNLVAPIDRDGGRPSSLPGRRPRTPDGYVESWANFPGFPRLSCPYGKYEGTFHFSRPFKHGCRTPRKQCQGLAAKSYNCSWSKWSSWCDKRQSNPILCPIEDIVNFLAEQYSEDNKPVGQHPLVVRLMKGISISRPPQPRYQFTWDVKTVTNFLTTLGENSSLSLKHLSLKLCMLMALTCPERSSIMAALDIRYVRQYPEGTKFLHTTYRKRSHNGSLGGQLTQNSLRILVQCLSTYLEKTKNWRPSSDNMQQILFLALKKPHRPVTSATLSRWLKEVIQLTGIKDIFKGRSVRAAWTSAAKRAGLGIGTVLSMADWTNTSTFKKF